MQGQKGKCKDDTKSDSLDRCEQVERSKSHTGEVQKLSPFFIINLLHNIMKSQINDAN